MSCELETCSGKVLQIRTKCYLCLRIVFGLLSRICLLVMGAVVQLVEYRTRNREVAGSTHTRSTASNLEQVANLLYAQANSASYPQRDGK